MAASGDEHIEDHADLALLADEQPGHLVAVDRHVADEMRSAVVFVLVVEGRRDGMPLQALTTLNGAGLPAECCPAAAATPAKNSNSMVVMPFAIMRFSLFCGQKEFLVLRPFADWATSHLLIKRSVLGSAKRRVARYGSDLLAGETQPHGLLFVLLFLLLPFGDAILDQLLNVALDHVVVDLVIAPHARPIRRNAVFTCPKAFPLRPSSALLFSSSATRSLISFSMFRLIVWSFASVKYFGFLYGELPPRAPVEHLAVNPQLARHGVPPCRRLSSCRRPDAAAS